MNESVHDGGSVKPGDRVTVTARGSYYLDWSGVVVRQSTECDYSAVLVDFGKGNLSWFEPWMLTQKWDLTAGEDGKE